MLQVDEALEQGKWGVACSEIMTWSPGMLKLLKHHTINGLPIFHYLARHRFRDEDQVELEKIMEIYFKVGYDFNTKTDNYVAQKRTSMEFTALLAAVEQSNLILIESLIKFGADPNIRDKSDFSACHWAVLVGDLRCLKLLIDGGATIESTLKERTGEDVHPILHTAVDEGRTEMVFYLLETGLADINENAVYRGVLSEKAFTNFPSRYNCEGTTQFGWTSPKALETEDISFTPLGRAVRMRKIPIIELLLKHNAQLSGFSELHFCIVEGDTEVACLLESYFTDEELKYDKIDGMWALHCLHHQAFLEEEKVEWTIDLISKYVDAGWDINAVTDNVIREACIVVESHEAFTITSCSLLHIACLFSSCHVIKYLVENGADVNLKTGEAALAQLYPLQILLLLNDYQGALILIENGADIHSTGCFPNPAGFSYKRLGQPVFDIAHCDGSLSFNSIEIPLRIGIPNSEPVLDMMLEMGINWTGAREFHVALEGGNPTFVSKVFQEVRQHLFTEDLCWARFPSFLDENEQAKVPSFVLFLEASWKKTLMDYNTVLNLLKEFVDFGYDCNLRWEPHVHERERYDPLIFMILQVDFEERENRLLEQLVEFDHVNLNVRNRKGETPVEYILNIWHCECLKCMHCWRKKGGTKCQDVIGLLLRHGADVTDLVIGRKFKYHYGYKDVIQMLCCAGAKVTDDFFESPVCHAGYVGTRGFHEEVLGLKKWIEEKNRQQQRFNLGFLARIQVRKMLRTVGDLKILDELPITVRQQVVCEDISNFL